MESRNKSIPRYILCFLALSALAFAFIVYRQAATHPADAYTIPFLIFGGRFDFSITFFGITPYLFMEIVGVVLGLGVCVFDPGCFGMSRKEALLVAVLFYVQAVLGFKLLYALQTCLRSGDFRHWDFDGASVYGAFFASLILARLTARIVKKPTRTVLDEILVLGLLFLAFARIGCYFAGCCGAKLTSVNENPVFFPIQLIEVFFDLLILAACLWYNDNGRRPGRRYIGMYPLGIMSYTLVRFVLEFWRTNPITMLGISEAQIHSVILFVAALALALTAPREPHPVKPGKKQR